MKIRGPVDSVGWEDLLLFILWGFYSYNLFVAYSIWNLENGSYAESSLEFCGFSVKVVCASKFAFYL